jgi:hypothetical protein
MLLAEPASMLSRPSNGGDSGKVEDSAIGVLRVGVGMVVLAVEWVP